jgi:uroporphyrinogen decarboxylase
MNSRKLMISALMGQRTPRPPVWFMRQAGRYMSEYRELRKKHSFMELCHEPDLATEITLQPIRSFDMDAAIFFCDILVTAEALGSQVDIIEKRGPVIANPFRLSSDLDQLLSSEEAMGKLEYTSKALRQIRGALSEDKALLGFVGAPLTVASYMIEGGSSSSVPTVFRMIAEEPKLFQGLMERLTDLSILYIESQRNAGVDAVQIFESWASLLPLPIYREHVFPHLKRLVEATHHPEKPLILFALAQQPLWDLLGTLPVHALSLGHGLSLTGMRDRFPGKALQGNLDSRFLLCEKETLLKAADDILEEMSNQPGYIFNLGHGITPPTPEDHIAALVERVRQFG